MAFAITFALLIGFNVNITATTTNTEYYQYKIVMNFYFLVC